MLTGNEQASGSFDWDQDFDDLVKDGAIPDEALYTYEPVAPVAPPAPPATAQSSGMIRGMLGKFVLPACMVVALGFGVAFPEKIGLVRSQVQTASLFVPFSTDLLPGADTAEHEAVNLLVYTAAQKRNFNAGLRRFSDADLLIYARVTQDDLDRAGPMLRPMLQDALALTQGELKRRNLSVVPVLRAVEDVHIQLPLRG